MFNSVMAGFTLAKKCGFQRIHSGKLGCGAFNNSIYVVYFVQRLAACHLGLDLVLHAYSAREAKECELMWHKIYPSNSR